jgi:hypothetical protein
MFFLQGKNRFKKEGYGVRKERRKEKKINEHTRRKIVAV